MYYTLLIIQSLARWLLLVCLLATIYKSWVGVRHSKPFTRRNNFLRRSTVGLTYFLLLAGLLQYSNSPWVKHYLTNPGGNSPEPVFFGVIHGAIMLVSVIMITFGSARAAYLTNSADKHRSLLVWFTIALVLIIIAIPWPFSPFAQRPLIR